MKVKINNKTIIFDDCSIANVSCNSGTISINGKVVSEGHSGDVHLNFGGHPVGEVINDGSVTCGSVNNYVNSQGSVNCNNVGGDVDAGGSVNCNNVTGSIDAGGSVSAQGQIGNVKAGGSIRIG